MENGDFADVGDDFSFVKPESPEHMRFTALGVVFQEQKDEYGWIVVDVGVCLLERAISELPALDNGDFVQGVLCASQHEALDDSTCADADFAAECLAYDVRDLFRTQGGVTTTETSPNWRLEEPPSNVVPLFRTT